MEASFRKADAGLAELERRVRKDLDDLCRPPANWVVPHEVDGAPVVDVVIVGGGMCGMLIWFALQSAGVRNLRIVDRNPEGIEGPWVTYARMETLRSPKHLTGPAYGMASLTFRAWFEAGVRRGGLGSDGQDPAHDVDGLSPLVQERALSVPIENNVERAGAFVPRAIFCDLS